MTSQDTLGYGATANVGLGANATINSNIPDLRHPGNMKVTSIEGGLGLPGFAVTSANTPQQIADYIFSPAMGPQDELTPFQRSLQSKNGSIGVRSEPAVPFLTPGEQSPLGGGMGDWSASATHPSISSTASADSFENSSSPVLSYLEKYRQSATPQAGQSNSGR